MADMLHAAGVPENDVHLEDASTNTSENLRFALPILDQLGTRDVVIVSDTYHLTRARMLARRLGLRVLVSAPPSKDARLWPQIKGWLREIPGLVAVLLRLR